jgi:folate-binding protein YgfZ
VSFSAKLGSHPETTLTTIETPLADLHRATGTELAPYFGVLLPLRFGDSANEYRVARQTAALIDTNFRAVFSLSGPDRARYLNAVLTGNVRGLAAGEGTIGLLLNSQGHILAELETLALEDRILILGHEFLRERTAQTLDKFIIMDDATLTDQTAETGTLAVEGPAVPAIAWEIAGADFEALPERGHVAVKLQTSSGEIACRMLRHSLYGFPGIEFLAPRESLQQVWSALASAIGGHGGAPIGYAALNALRLEAGVPWIGADFDDHQIPHEAGLETTHISFTKGCYTGQEIVERVRSRGHVNRRLTGLAFGGAEPPPHGTALLAAGADAGSVTSAAFSPFLGRAIGMGYVRREHNRPGQPLQCGADTAEVIALPLKGAIPATMPGAPAATDACGTN